MTGGFKFPRRVTRYVVIYDISAAEDETWASPSRKRRAKLLRFLLEYGIRTQKSVVELEISPRNVAYLARKIERAILPLVDKVYFYPLENRAVSKIKREGKVIPLFENIFI